MSGSVDVQDFIKHLHKQGLIIVNKEDYFENSEEKLAAKQKEILKKSYIKISEITKNKLLDWSKQNFLNKINSGDIADYEYRRLNDHYGTYQLTRKCVKRLIEDKPLLKI